MAVQATFQALKAGNNREKKYSRAFLWPLRSVDCSNTYAAKD